MRSLVSSVLGWRAGLLRTVALLAAVWMVVSLGPVAAPVVFAEADSPLSSQLTGDRLGAMPATAEGAAAATPGTCVTIQRGTLGAVADAYIWASSPGNNSGSSTTLYTGLVGPGEKRALVRFDLGVIPPYAVLDSATFGINTTSSSGQTVRLHRITASWTESGVTWTSFNNSFAPDVAASFVTNAPAGLHTADLTELVRAWWNGTQANYGILLEAGVTAYDTYRSSEVGTVSNRPQLQVCYHTLDYGDAPDTGVGTGVGNYQTTAADSGPNHVIVSGLQLGAVAPDADPGTLQNVPATADDTTGTPDDEDGVTTLPTITTASASVPLAVSVLNNTGAAATLACWIDFNRDGDFLDSGERASAAVSSSAAQQTINLTFSGFAAPTAGASYLRCRLASAAAEVAEPTGAANSGEVEDYQVSISTVAQDFGDLPDTGTGTGAGNYQTLLADNGPRHIIVSGVQLGATVDGEPNGQPNVSATGDGADEDGVTFLTPLVAGRAAAIQVTASVAGCLNAWVDYNGNGVLTDSGEQIATNLALAAGVNTLNVTVPGGARGVLYSRFRFTAQCGQGGEAPTGPATTGEVEDYASAAIGNYVWDDNGAGGGGAVANDGVQNEPPSSGHNGVVVRLLDSSGNAVMDGGGNAITTVTANNPVGGEPGWYEFAGLPPGSYIVAFEQPNGYSFTLRFQGGDSALDSNANTTTGPTYGQSEVVNLAAGQNNTTIDAGLRVGSPTAVSLSGFSASRKTMPWGGFMLMGLVAGGLIMTQRYRRR